ncbi:tripartite tricarboxylate transporter permease [Thermodesulfobacteriota bacterium]
MGMLDAFAYALDMVFLWKNLLYIFTGTAIGLIFGALPGLSSVVSISMFLPLTYGMDPMSAMFFYSGLMGASPFGGSISAILINTPGTAQNIATIFDGYPMTQRGEASRALGISATASALGALFGILVLTILMPLVRLVILSFQPPEFFMLVLLGLCTVVVAVQGNMIKGLFAGGLGLTLSFMGRSALTGTIRFNFGTFYLWDGIVLVPFVIGLLAICEIITLGTKQQATIADDSAIAISGYKGILEGMKDVFRHKINFFRSASIGTIVGIIPGIGGVVANVVAYTVALQSSSHPETFGKGDPEGVLAPEAANNAKEGGSMVPTLGLGIPGSTEMAVLLGALILHGLTPGPLLIKENLDIVWALILGMTISSVLASVLGLLSSNFIVKISRVSVSYIIPIVGGICLVGVFSFRGNMWDVFLAIFFGFVGFGLKTFGFPIIPLVMGHILGKMAEVYFNQSLMISDIGYKIFFTRYISLGLFIGALFVLILPFIKKRFKKNDFK